MALIRPLFLTSPVAVTRRAGRRQPPALDPSREDRVEWSAPSGPGSISRWTRLRTGLWCALALVPGLGLCACQAPSHPRPAPPAVTTVVSLPPPTTVSPIVVSTVPQVTTTVVATSSPTTSVLVSDSPPPVEEAPAAWDWHLAFSPEELAPHQLYSNDCGVTAVRAELRAHGVDADQDLLFDDAIAGGFHAGRAKGRGWNGPYRMVEYLQSFGLDAHMEAFSQDNLQRQLDQGKPVIVSTERHYFVISGQNEDGALIAGATGEVVGMGSTLSYRELSQFGGAHRIIVVDSTDRLAETRLPATSLAQVV